LTSAVLPGNGTEAVPPFPISFEGSEWRFSGALISVAPELGRGVKKQQEIFLYFYVVIIPTTL
jgi:hypothetical protein